MNKLTREQMAARVAHDIPEGAYVNLGMGLPTLVANFLPRDIDLGVLNVGSEGVSVVDMVEGLSPVELSKLTGLSLRAA